MLPTLLCITFGFKMIKNSFETCNKLFQSTPYSLAISECSLHVIMLPTLLCITFGFKMIKNSSETGNKLFQSTPYSLAISECSLEVIILPASVFKDNHQ